MIKTDNCCNCFEKIFPEIDKTILEYQERTIDNNEREIILKFRVCSQKCLKDLKFKKKNWK